MPYFWASWCSKSLMALIWSGESLERLAGSCMGDAPFDDALAISFPGRRAVMLERQSERPIRDVSALVWFRGGCRSSERF